MFHWSILPEGVPQRRNFGIAGIGLLRAGCYFTPTGNLTVSKLQGNKNIKAKKKTNHKWHSISISSLSLKL